MRFANAVIAVSSHLKDDVTTRNRRGASIRVISNGATMPGDTGTAALEELGITPGRYILSVGRLVPDKGWDIALDGIALLDPATSAGLEYVIAGGARIETDYVRTLHDRAHASRLPVRLLGMVAPETVEELYAGARVHLAPSFQEGQPLTVLEAMSHGCCIVASDIPAHREVIGDAGALYAVKDPAALADVLHRVLGDDDLRTALGARARAAVEQRDDSRGTAPPSPPRPCSSRWAAAGDGSRVDRIAVAPGRASARRRGARHQAPAHGEGAPASRVRDPRRAEGGHLEPVRTPGRPPACAPRAQEGGALLRHRALDVPRPLPRVLPHEPRAGRRSRNGAAHRCSPVRPPPTTCSIPPRQRARIRSCLMRG